MILGIILGVLALAGSGVAVWLGIKNTYRDPWMRPIPGHASTTGYQAPPGFDARRIGWALTNAINQLGVWTRWRSDQIAKVASNVTVTVRSGAEWKTDWSDKKVAGMTLGRELVVGSTLAALCHELAHLCEAEIDGATNSEHTTWEARGIQRASNEFEVWVAQQKW